MSNKIYPAIYKSEDGNLYLYENRANCYSFGYKNWIGSNDNIFDTHESDKNITREYLANTYGKVGSKERADFIVKLAENHNVDICNTYNSECKYFNFYIEGGKLILAFFEKLASATSEGEKQITIPMPPKCDDVKPILTAEITHDSIKVKDSEGNEVKPSYKSKSSVTDADATIAITDATPTLNDCTVDSDFYPPPLNNGGNLLFGGEDKCKEWPCVGDEVANKGIKWKVAAEYKHMVMLVTDDDCGFALARKNDLQKPKTPEEELRDEIASDLNKMQLVSNLVKANELMAKYNITKKPQ